MSELLFKPMECNWTVLECKARPNPELFRWSPVPVEGPERFARPNLHVEAEPYQTVTIVHDYRENKDDEHPDDPEHKPIKPHVFRPNAKPFTPMSKMYGDRFNNTVVEPSAPGQVAAKQRYIARSNSVLELVEVQEDHVLPDGPNLSCNGSSNPMAFNPDLLKFVTPLIPLQPGMNCTWFNPQRAVGMSQGSQTSELNLKPMDAPKFNKKAYFKPINQTRNTPDVKLGNVIKKPQKSVSHTIQGGVVTNTTAHNIVDNRKSNQVPLGHCQPYLPYYQNWNGHLVPLINPYNPMTYNPELFKYVTPYVPMQPESLSSKSRMHAGMMKVLNGPLFSKHKIINMNGGPAMPRTH